MCIRDRSSLLTVFSMRGLATSIASLREAFSRIRPRVPVAAVLEGPGAESSSSSAEADPSAAFRPPSLPPRDLRTSTTTTMETAATTTTMNALKRSFDDRASDIGVCKFLRSRCLFNDLLLGGDGKSRNRTPGLCNPYRFYVGKLADPEGPELPT